MKVNIRLDKQFHQWIEFDWTIFLNKLQLSVFIYASNWFYKIFIMYLRKVYTKYIINFNWFSKYFLSFLIVVKHWNFNVKFRNIFYYPFEQVSGTNQITTVKERKLRKVKEFSLQITQHHHMSTHIKEVSQRVINFPPYEQKLFFLSLFIEGFKNK